jgi:hypothetical protein
MQMGLPLVADSTSVFPARQGMCQEHSGGWRQEDETSLQKRLILEKQYGTWGPDVTKYRGAKRHGSASNLRSGYVASNLYEVLANYGTFRITYVGQSRHLTNVRRCILRVEREVLVPPDGNTGAGLIG